jgi:two-component system CheB/CheR fusion protein
MCDGRRTDGRAFPAEATSALVDDLGIYVLLVRDVSQRRDLERQVIEISTREQERIGQEMHDGLGQQLTAVSLLAKRLDRRLHNGESTNVAADARTLSVQLEQALTDSRRLTQGLAPIGVAPECLLDGLRTLARDVQISSGVECEVLNDDGFAIESSLVAAHIYRIIQEAVNNAVRHGEPRRIQIRLTQNGAMIRFSVQDDGTWREPRPGGHGGLGLHIMSYRAGIVGGRLTVGPAPDGGTVMRCEMPLQQPSDAA